ncbi:hypothetical protein ACFO0M_05425 [Micromonospora mangrovi]|uniref:Uncharacterized protein n=2 Tax=Micromonospora TaxID=1873 RepID=A0AAU8H6N3_9ACTN
MPVIHQPRVAWDTARVIVDAARDDEVFRWFSQRVGDLLGPTVEDALEFTRLRLRQGDHHAPIEAGRWRVRLEDTLRDRPEVAEELRSLAVITAGLLRTRSVAPAS